MSLKVSAQDLLKSFVEKFVDGRANIAADLLRVLQEEAHLLCEKQKILDLCDQDPFRCFRSEDDSGNSQLDDAKQQIIIRFNQCLEVTSCHRISTRENYCLTEAVIRHSTSHANSQQKESNTPLRKRSKTQEQRQQPVQLFFRYERRPATDDSVCSIWYSIDYAEGFGPRRNLLLIRVWAEGNKPSRLPAISIDDDEGGDDDWEDVDEEVEDCPEKYGGNRDANSSSRLATSQRGSIASSPKCTKHQDDNHDNDNPKKDDTEPRDHFACFLDPELLHTFMKSTNLSSLDEATAFFVLMTFPYYEHEWDLVGFVLDSVFGNEDE